jgi:hypothetical protein
MKIIIWTILVCIAFWYIAGAHVSFKPFKFSLDTPYTLIGIICLSFAIGFLNHQAKMDGIEKGFEAGWNHCVSEVKKAFKEDKDEKLHQMPKANGIEK